MKKFGIRITFLTFNDQNYFLRHNFVTVTVLSEIRCSFSLEFLKKKHKNNILVSFKYHKCLKSGF